MEAQGKALKVAGCAQALGVDVSKEPLQRLLRACRRADGKIDYEMFWRALEPPPADQTASHRKTAAKPRDSRASPAGSHGGRNSTADLMGLIAHCRPVDFGTGREYESWLSRQTKVVIAALDCKMADIFVKRNPSCAGSTQSLESERATACPISAFCCVLHGAECACSLPFVC